MTVPEIDVPNPSPAGLLHPSNLLTYMAVLMAATAVVSATILQNTAAAGAAMALAVIADTFDGRFARLFERTRFQSAFGVQLDSLADAITSGFVPVIVVASTALGEPWWRVAVWAIAAAAYVIAALTRLGYYNLTESSQPYFVGLPAPAATLIMSSVLLSDPSAISSAVALAVCAIAMISPVRIPRPRGVALAVFAAWAVLLVVSHTRAVLS
jgi:CDP-diacylglycerol--serine O-phosphatidyltransferase